MCAAGGERGDGDGALGEGRGAEGGWGLPIDGHRGARHRHLPRESAVRRHRLAVPARVLDPRLARQDRRAHHVASRPAVVPGAVGGLWRGRRLRSRPGAALPRGGDRAGHEAGSERGDALSLRARRVRGDPLLNWVAIAIEYVVFWLILPFLLLHPRVRQGIRLRLGLYRPAPVAQGRPRGWRHGASAGDGLRPGAVGPEAQALRADAPGGLAAVTHSR